MVTKFEQNIYTRAHKIKGKINNTSIYKENYPFQQFWVGFFFPKTPSIFNTNNTCNK